MEWAPRRACCCIIATASLSDATAPAATTRTGLIAAAVHPGKPTYGSQHAIVTRAASVAVAASVAGLAANVLILTHAAG